MAALPITCGVRAWIFSDGAGIGLDRKRVVPTAATLGATDLADADARCAGWWRDIPVSQPAALFAEHIVNRTLSP
jgi:hypothetical protein